MRRWHHVISAVGILVLAAAVVQTVQTLAVDGSTLTVVIDAVLMGVPGLVLLYLGRWLPASEVDASLYPRIVAWGAGGVAVMFVVIVLRVLHPGVVVTLQPGTKLVSLATGTIAGLAIGVHEARAITRASELECRNAALERADAAERRNAELERTRARLEQAVAALETSNERLEEFAYAASHDLQEPLRMVSSYLQLLERRYGDALDEDGEEFIEFAVDGADRMRGMIDGLLEYSRVETQGEPFDDVDLDEVLDDVITDLQFKIEESEAEIEREPLPTVRGDGGQLRQVLQNLVTNAIDYSGDAPPRIRISASRSDGAWAVAVRDEGVGIDPADADRIFTIFQRLHAAEECGGSGIGLALCERIVERHGGEIQVDSEPGEGSTFTVTLPETPEAELSAPAQTASSSAPSVGSDV